MVLFCVVVVVGFVTVRLYVEVAFEVVGVAVVRVALLEVVVRVAVEPLAVERLFDVVTPLRVCEDEGLT